MTTINRALATGLAHEDLRAIETFYTAFEGRPDLLEDAVTGDWQDIPLAPHQQPGREGMKPLIAGFNAAFPDTRVVIHEVVGSDGRAAVRATISGTHSGDWFGVLATGRSFGMTIHDFHHIKDGRLTHTWHLEDWLGWLGQVGAWPATPSETGQ